MATSCNFPCICCGRSREDDRAGVQWDGCDLWFHSMCLGLTDDEYQELQASSVDWFCRTCLPGPVNVSEAGGAPADVSSYFDVDSSADSIRLSVYYSNCRSVLPKKDDLTVLAEVDKPDIIAICETWLGKEVRPSEVALPEFRSYQLDCTRHGGGCCSTSMSALVQ